MEQGACYLHDDNLYWKAAGHAMGAEAKPPGLGVDGRKGGVWGWRLGVRAWDAREDSKSISKSSSK